MPEDGWLKWYGYRLSRRVNIARVACIHRVFQFEVWPLAADISDTETTAEELLLAEFS